MKKRIVYFFVLVYPWEWRFIAETWRGAHVYEWFGIL